MTAEELAPFLDLTPQQVGLKGGQVLHQVNGYMECCYGGGP